MSEVKAKFGKRKKKYLECPAKEPELHSEGKAAARYFEISVLHICCVLIIVIGTEASTMAKTKVVLSSWNLQCRGKGANRQVLWGECLAPSQPEQRL